MWVKVCHSLYHIAGHLLLPRSEEFFSVYTPHLYKHERLQVNTMCLNSQPGIQHQFVLILLFRVWSQDSQFSALFSPCLLTSTLSLTSYTQAPASYLSPSKSQSWSCSSTPPSREEVLTLNLKLNSIADAFWQDQLPMYCPSSPFFDF